MQENKVIKIFRKIEHGFVAVENIFLIASLILIVGSITYQVVCRYVIKIPSLPKSTARIPKR